jgi:hypothetical protein
MRISWEQLTEGLHRGARCLAFFLSDSSDSSPRCGGGKGPSDTGMDATVNGNI